MSLSKLVDLLGRVVASHEEYVNSFERGLSLLQRDKDQLSLPPWRRSFGTLDRRIGQRYGFILDDDGTSTFVLPRSRKAFANQLPWEGQRMSYSVVQDAITKLPRADDVEPLTDPYGGCGFLPPPLPRKRKPQEHVTKKSPRHVGGESSASPPGRFKGVMNRTVFGRYGFIRSESDGTDIFVLPQSC